MLRIGHCNLIPEFRNAPTKAAASLDGANRSLQPKAEPGSQVLPESCIPRWCESVTATNDSTIVERPSEGRCTPRCCESATATGPVTPCNRKGRREGEGDPYRSGLYRG